MADGFYDTRADTGNSADATPVDPWEAAADFDARTDRPSFDTSVTSFSGTLSASALAGTNGAKNPADNFSGVLGQSGLAS